MGSSAVVLVTNERFNYPVKNLRQIRKMRSANCTLCDKIEAPMENSSYKVLALLNIFSGVLSVASNLLVLTAVYNFSPLRKVSIFFILSLAVADFLVGLVMNPVYAWIFFVNATEENHPLRVAEHWLWLQAVVISTFTLTAVSIERYIAVTKCLHYLEIVTAKRCLCCVALTWLFSIIYASLRFFIHRAKDLPALWISTTMLTVFIPFFIILYCYICIFKAARTQCMRIATDSSSTNAAYCKEVLKNKKAAWTLCIVIGLFALLWSPSFILSLWDSMTADPCGRRCVNYLWFWASFLSFTSSFCNPWIYSIRMREFRLAFFKILRINHASANKEA